MSIIPIVFAALPYLIHTPCTERELDRVLAPATQDDSAVRLSCDLELQSQDVVTKQLIFEGSASSGASLRCNGAQIDARQRPTSIGQKVDMIQVRSRRIDRGPDEMPAWDAPRYIHISDCEIWGSIRVRGMGNNGEAPDVRASSSQPDHTQAARLAAPSEVVFERLKLHSLARIPLYLAPGTNRITLQDSLLDGKSESTAIYMDAESYQNRIVGNVLDVFTDREVIAVDGSSHNLIQNNLFKTIKRGGVYLYRNCGEGGTARHATPSYNHILNNVFRYQRSFIWHPAVHIGSRNGLRTYCWRDRHLDYGSARSNLDHARNNVVMQNQLYYNSPDRLIRVGRPESTDVHNELAHNEWVRAHRPRPAGCYVPNSFATDFIAHAARTRGVRKLGDQSVCRWSRCDDGKLLDDGPCTESLDQVEVECRQVDRNAACIREARCPAGRTILAVTAACNLEWGEATEHDLASVDAGNVQVIQTSQDVQEGTCMVGATHTSRGLSPVRGEADTSSLYFGCVENDENGGDCHVRAQLHCL